MPNFDPGAEYRERLLHREQTAILLRRNEARFSWVKARSLAGSSSPIRRPRCRVLPPTPIRKQKKKPRLSAPPTPPKT